MRLYLLSLLTLSAAMAGSVSREVTYASAPVMGIGSVPYFERGYLIYRHQGSRIEIHGPDGQKLFGGTLECPQGKVQCGVSAVAADGKGMIAVGIAHASSGAEANVIRLMTAQGRETRLIKVAWFVPTRLCFDARGDLWAMGWERDADDREIASGVDYATVRKFSAEGKELGRYLPRSLWPGKVTSPASAAIGYWWMAAAKESVGALAYPNHADHAPEWVEWDLEGRLIARTPLPDIENHGFAYTADGVLYARFQVGKSKYELRRMERGTGRWTAVKSNLPEEELGRPGFLQGGDGEALVYRVSTGAPVLRWVKPGE